LPVSVSLRSIRYEAASTLRTALLLAEPKALAATEQAWEELDGPRRS
jgi:hypothetical protein